MPFFGDSPKIFVLLFFYFFFQLLVTCEAVNNCSGAESVLESIAVIAKVDLKDLRIAQKVGSTENFVVGPAQS